MKNGGQVSDKRCQVPWGSPFLSLSRISYGPTQTSEYDRRLRVVRQLSGNEAQDGMVKLSI